jgi:hypothetical protein
MYEPTATTGCCGSVHTVCQKCGGPRNGRTGHLVLDPPIGSLSAQYRVQVCGYCWDELLDLTDRWLDLYLPRTPSNTEPRPALPLNWTMPQQHGNTYRAVKP